MSVTIVEAFVALKYTENSQLTALLSLKDLAFGMSAVPRDLAITNCTHRGYEIDMVGRYRLLLDLFQLAMMR